MAQWIKPLFYKQALGVQILSMHIKAECHWGLLVILEFRSRNRDT